jgi:hypothetical protein
MRVFGVIGHSSLTAAFMRSALVMAGLLTTRSSALFMGEGLDRGSLGEVNDNGDGDEGVASAMPEM